MLSGGIALLDDLRRLRKLSAANVVGVIVGRALYEDAFTLQPRRWPLFAG